MTYIKQKTSSLRLVLKGGAIPRVFRKGMEVQMVFEVEGRKKKSNFFFYETKK